MRRVDKIAFRTLRRPAGLMGRPCRLPRRNTEKAAEIHADQQEGHEDHIGIGGDFLSVFKEQARPRQSP